MFRMLATIFIFFYSAGSFSETHELWDNEKQALAYCDVGNELSCYIIFDQLKVNVSQVESLNLRKLGSASRDKYERVITIPVKWSKSSDSELIVLFKTQAWVKGKRYTVTEPVLIRNGKYTVR